MTVKLTPRLMNKIIEEELKKFGKVEPVEDRADDTEETDADEYADSLENKIDYAKALKIEESRLQRRLVEIRTTLKVLGSIKRKA
jgi:tRNA isopentenyl-2-thiomethyl-A-37 hydroxylase MiaE